MYVHLRTDVDDPVERLPRAATAAAGSKAEFGITKGARLENWIEVMPLPLLRMLGRMFDRIKRLGGPSSENLIVSNVPGPRAPLYAGDAKMTAFYSVGPLNIGVGLNITVWSYVDQLNFSLSLVARRCPEQYVFLLAASSVAEYVLLVALFVGAFVIANSLSITIAQRTREFATLRTIGASRRQVLNSVIVEAFVVGVVASLVGLLLGLGLAKGLFKLFDAAGLTLPNNGLTLETRTIVVSLALGILVTLLASVYPALRATMVPPIAAVREGATLPSEPLDAIRGTSEPSP